MPLLTKKEAAAELGVTEANLDAWRWKGIGPAFIKLPRGNAVRSGRASPLDSGANLPTFRNRGARREVTGYASTPSLYP